MCEVFNIKGERVPSEKKRIGPQIDADRTIWEIQCCLSDLAFVPKEKLLEMRGELIRTHQFFGAILFDLTQ